jgi:hypothetical protein
MGVSPIKNKITKKSMTLIFPNSLPLSSIIFIFPLTSHSKLLSHHGTAFGLNQKRKHELIVHPYGQLLTPAFRLEPANKLSRALALTIFACRGSKIMAKAM